MTFEIEPVGFVRSTRRKVEDDGWDQEQAAIELDAARFGGEALSGLEGFSHVEVLYLMDQVEPSKIAYGARHPRNDRRWPKVGIFSQRGKNRPNRLGLTVCRVVRVQGRTIEVAGLDAVDGTPVIDLKPWYSAYGPRGSVHEPRWVAEVMADYW